MQMFAMCMECFKKLGRPSFEPFWVPYYNDRIGYMECSQGHKSALILQSQKFEVLLDQAQMRLQQGSRWKLHPLSRQLSSGFTNSASKSFRSIERWAQIFTRKCSIQWLGNRRDNWEPSWHFMRVN